MRRILFSVLMGAAAIAIAEGVMAAMGQNVHPTILIGIGIVLAVLAYFINAPDRLKKGWAWFWKEENTRIRMWTKRICLMLLIVVAGWPRIEGWLSSRQLITEKWMSEKDSEEFIARVLIEAKHSSDLPKQLPGVFQQRVRVLIVDALTDQIGTRFRRPKDTTWQRLGLSSQKTNESLGIDLKTYDGTKPLSVAIKGEVEFFTEHVYRWPWVERDNIRPFTRPDPQKD